MVQVDNQLISTPDHWKTQLQILAIIKEITGNKSKK